MSTLHDDEIRTIGESGRLDPQADADGDDTDTTDGDATDTDSTTPTRTRPTPTRTTRTRRTARRTAEAALARCLEPVAADDVLRGALGAAAARRPAERAGAVRRPPLRGRRRAARLLHRDPVPGVPARSRGRAARGRRLHRGRAVAAGVHEDGGRPPRPRGVGGRRDHRPAGAARQLASAGRLLPAARGGDRAAGAGELLLHAARLARLRRAPRHPRRARAPGRGREAVAPVRAAPRAPAQAPALLEVAR